MARDWKDIDTDVLLNYEEAHTGRMAQYERIMRHRETEALSEVSAGLIDVKKVIHETAGSLEKRLKILEGFQEKTAKTQGKLQKITVVLTVVIALATVFYTGATWGSVLAQREANNIQKQLISMNGNTTNVPTETER